MGLFDRIFGKRVIRPATDYKTLTAYTPSFTSYNGQLYENELVRAAIHAKAQYISKLRVDFTGNGAEGLRNRLQNPNAFQTWSQFLYRTKTIYEANNTVFIVNVKDEYGRVKEIYPVLPTRSKLVEINGEPWLAFEFCEGKYAQLPVWEVGVMTRFQYKNDVFGESNRALDSTMELINIQNQGISEGVKSAATYRFMAQLDNFSKADALAKERQRFDEENFGPGTSGGGLLLFPSTYKNMQQIDSKPFVVNAAQMQIIQNNVFNYFNVNEDILQCKAYGDKLTAFYEGDIEPWSVQFHDVMTKMFHMLGELRGDGEVSLLDNRFQYMGAQEKLTMSTDFADRGIMNRDEIRGLWGMEPIPNGEGQAYTIRGEYKNAATQLEEGNNNE